MQHSELAFSYNFSIDGHRMTVIETDGVETEPLTVDSLTVFSGQRYSIIVEANQTVGNYCSSHYSSSLAIGLSDGFVRDTC